MQAKVSITAETGRWPVVTRRGVLLHALIAGSLCSSRLPAAEWHGHGTKIGPVRSVLEYEVAMRAARLRNRFALVDVGADWCEFCAILDDQILTDARITKFTKDLAVVRVDVTSMDRDARELLSHLSVEGPPTLFIVETGSMREHANTRSVGSFDVENLVERLRRIGLKAAE